jgi:predicted nucleic-acid-binding protein
VVYIGNDIWSNYKKVQLLEAYNQGKADIIDYLIQEAGKCEVIPVFSGDKEEQLIGVDCP